MKRLLVFIFFVTAAGLMLLLAQQVDTAALQTQADTLVAQEKYREATVILDRLLNANRQAKDWKQFGVHAKQLADAWYEQAALDTALQVLDRSLATLAAAGWADSLPAAPLWTWKGFIFKCEARISDALEAYNQATGIYERNRYNHLVVAYSYKNLAQLLIRRRDYEQADQNLYAAIGSDSTGQLLLSIYGQLANNAFWQDSLDKALHFYEIGKTLPGDGGYESASLQSIGASIMLEKGRLGEARSLVTKALAYYRTDPDEAENQMRCYTTLADVARLQGDVRTAEVCYRAAESVGLPYYNGRKDREMAKLYTEWGDFLVQQNRREEALARYQKAIIQAFPAFNNPDPAANPGKESLPIEQWAVYAPARKAALLLQNPSRDRREQAAECFDRAFAVAELLRRSYGTDQAKLYFAEQNFDLRRSAVLNLWNLYQETHLPQTLERLFTLLEDNRANALRDALQQQRALILAGIPDSLLRIEKSLRRALATAQNDLQEAVSEKDSAGIAVQKTELFRLERDYNQLLANLAKIDPQFAAFNNAGQSAGLDQIRAALPPSAVLLSWFDAGDRYLCLALRQHTLHAFETTRDSALDGTLLRFQQLLPDKNRQETDPAAYFADAYFLKQRLLPDSLLAGTDQLIMVPDGGLSYLPFEALLTAPHQGGYATAPYLLRTHAVQYAWSASLIQDDPSRHAPGQGLLQVAPFVRSARDGLAVLPNSLHEKPERTAARVLEGEEAVADTFLQDASRFDVLHLSTHAHAGQKEQPGIEFYDRTVWLPEIYAQRLNASLVSLSACETGAGAFAEGEGVLSLARAFAYAGARSLVASHWSVNERSTADLFDAFYQFLGQGLSKSQALRQAKLQMLARNGADARKAPFHWAAFTLSGADGPVDLGGGFPRWVWGLAAAVAGLGVLGIWFILKKKSV